MDHAQPARLHLLHHVRAHAAQDCGGQLARRFIGVRAERAHFEEDRAQQADTRRVWPGHHAINGARQLRHHDLRRLLAHRGCRLADGIQRGVGVDHTDEKGLLAGKEAVEVGPRNACARGHLVHRKRGEAVGSDELEGGLEDALAGVWFRLEAQGAEERGPGLEFAVEAGLGRARRGRDRRHGGSVVSRQRAPRACQDSISSRPSPGHESILDWTSRPVKYQG